MAIAYVQGIRGFSVDVSTPAVFSGNNTAGNLLVVAYSIDANQDTITFSAPTDTRGNTYAHAVTVANATSGAKIAVYYALNCAGGANTVTGTRGSGSAIFCVYAHEYSGLATASALDQTATGTKGCVGAELYATGDATTTTADELLFCVGGCMDGFYAVQTAGTNFTGRTDYNGNFSVLTEDRIVSATGTYTGSMTSKGTGQAAIALATFKIAGPAFKGAWARGSNQLIG